MRKIFQIGFHNCGTRSLSHFFWLNNFATFHYYTYNEKDFLVNQLFKNLFNSTIPGYTKFDKDTEGPFPEKQGIFYSDMEKFINKKEKILMFGNVFFKWEGYKLFRELDRSYPGSLFILNKRDDWIESEIKKHYPEKDIEPFFTTKQLKKHLKKELKEHFKNVRKYFEGRNDFIEFHIQKDNINKLADWLEKHEFEITKREFPKIREHKGQKLII